MTKSGKRDENSGIKRASPDQSITAPIHYSNIHLLHPCPRYSAKRIISFLKRMDTS